MNQVAEITKTIEYQGCLISSLFDGECFSYLIQNKDPWGGLHHFAESEDLYETEEEAIGSAREYIDDYEPEYDALDFDYATELRHVMSNYQRLK